MQTTYSETAEQMIFVFKTSVRTRTQVRLLTPHIEKIIPDRRWNFDLQDCDRILRVDMPEDVSATIIELLKLHQFHCEELQ